jgi:Chaperone for flagella basal body P-ring formation
MSRRCLLPVEYRLYMTLLLSVCILVCAGPLQAACYRTPRAAIDSFNPATNTSPVSAGGYRVTGLQSDPILEQRWALVISCDHPEWPVSAVPLEESGSSSSSSRMSRASQNMAPAKRLVRAGDLVRLWRQEDRLRIEIAGVSEDSGGLGDTIRVRLQRRNTEESSTQAEFSGIIRGPSDVEMQP